MKISDMFEIRIGKLNPAFNEEIITNIDVVISRETLSIFHHIDTYETDEFFRLQGYVLLDDVDKLPSNVEIELAKVYSKKEHRKIVVVYISNWKLPK